MALLQMKWQPNHKRKNAPPLGLRNLGNSCYLNSVLQCLTYTPPLANFCLNNLHSSLCDIASEPNKKRDCPFCILEKRIARSLSIDSTLDTPAKIVGCLRLFAEHFKCGRQEDAHEFLRYVIDACHNTCLRLKKLQQQQQRSKKIANGGGGENSGSNTVVQEIFGGALQSQVKCLLCGNESNKVDEIMDVCLEVSQSNSLKEALRKFFQAETLDGDNKYNCERCKKLVAAKKQMSILQAPNILVVQLKRFEGIFGGKIDRAIAFEEFLVLSNFMSKGSQDSHPEYSLFATIVHSGFSQESGHYYAYVKDAMCRWYCCNDSYVTLSTLQEVLSEKAYILFFTRTSPRPVSTGKTVNMSNGAKSHETNGNTTVKGTRLAPANAMDLKSFNAPPLKSIPVANSSGSLQNKFSSLENSFSKRNIKHINGKTDAPKRDSVGNNGNVDKLMSGKHTSALEKDHHPSNGKHAAPESSHSIVNGNGRVQDGVIGSMNGDLHKDNGLKGKEFTRKVFSNGAIQNGDSNGHVDISGSKRKLEERDSCILLAKDSKSQAMVQEFKKLLQQEAAVVLRSCGWTDKVYEYMRSRKRLCMDVDTSDNTKRKKLLISDAKEALIREIPASLKGSLIERIMSFVREK